MICDKESFASPHDAKDKLISLTKRKRKQKFRLYKCCYCGMYHITTISKFLKSNKVKQKYPFRLKEDFRPTAPPPTPRQLKREREFRPATQKVLTPLQAEILKHKIKMLEHENNRA